MAEAIGMNTGVVNTLTNDVNAMLWPNFRLTISRECSENYFGGLKI